MFGEIVNFGYEFRQYDSRLSRWWSVDPKWNEYPGISPYVFCADNPIMLVDPDGEKVVPLGLLEYYGKAQYENSHLGEVQKIGIYNVIPIYDNNNKIISYNAVREYTIRGETYLAGAKWVGEGVRLSSSGKAWISADGTRQYRMPAHKKKSGKYQANFESRSSADGKWTNDGHLDIITE